ncbi:class I SAM-dependent rRNA methyltransferase [Dissulfurispira sp.]|uniref:class I SAM-dependent rRNA methyltransferase n=1 Tax=Dissulfurispira sp. TaxID=2817609 RepID=UPI002FD99181
MEKIILRRTSRILSGHLWIFSNELSTSPKNYEPGSLVEVYDNKNKFIGIGYINPHSLISVRLLTREREKINHDFFRKRIVNAINYRKRFLPESNSFRVIYSEGDFLPGLIVDKYADCLVIQFSTLGIEMMKAIVISVLDEILSPSVIVLRNDSQSRILEGLPLEKKAVKGSLDSLPIINEGEILIEVDPMTGQKTGFFLDQRENRVALSNYIKEGRGLDLFCYSGAWGLQLAKNGAFVTCVDDSETALSKAKRNFELNRLEDRCDFVKDDVFKFMKREMESGSLYDFIVLDPPAFVKSRAKVKEALKGYREINAMAMRLIKKGGMLATSSCSYHIEKAMFLDMLRDSARDAGRNPRLMEYRSQGRDHPILLSVPETEYLKCAFLEL